MFCEEPKVSISKRGNVYVNRCGKCRACRLSKANEKMIISIFAANEYKTKGQFLTLTYNDEHLPYGLQIEHFQSFMKKLRELDGTPGVKMFYAGEYGSESGREHWHVLFYNHKYDIDLVQKAWSEPRPRGRKPKDYIDVFVPLGFVYDGTLTPQSMKYVSGYIDKKGYDPGSGKRPPFGRSSCNLPDNLTPKEQVDMCRTGQISYNGRKFSVPRNWRKRYKELWQHFSSERNANKPKVEHLFKYTLDSDVPIYCGDSDGSTPAIVRAKMDEKEIKFNLRKKKKSRIMSQ